MSYFRLSEFRCPHCQSTVIDPRLMAKLEELRDIHGGPITITSGYRCPTHNKAVGGVTASQHVYGRAADIKSSDLNKLYEDAQKIFKAVGDGRVKGFVHVDLRDDKVRRWVY